MGGIFDISGCKVKYFSDIANMFKTPSNILLLQCRRGLLIVRHLGAQTALRVPGIIKGLRTCCAELSEELTAQLARGHKPSVPSNPASAHPEAGRMLKSLNDGEQGGAHGGIVVVEY